MDDRDLEAMFRSTLHDRADDVADTGSVADRSALARVAVRRRRRIAGTIAVVAAVTVVTPIAVVAATHDAAPAPTAAHPSSWRAESYNGIQLWVPPSWGWGLTPSVMSTGLRQCGFGAYAGSGSTGDLRYSKADAAPPYVGRPMTVGKDCPTPPRQSVAHVWFASPLPVGTSGTSTTVSVTGLTPFRVTVADADVSERKAILDSVERVDTDAHGCPSAIPRHEASGGSGMVGSMSVCLYAVESTGETVPRRYLLLYSAAVPAARSQEAYDAIQTARSQHAYISNLCIGTPDAGLARIDIVAHTVDGSWTYGIDPFQCDGRLVYSGGSDMRPVTQASVRLWAVDAVPLYAGGGSVGNALTPYLPH
ncbi:MAG: hypothetical protein ACR2JU_03610 [Nocardioidaceae bacterium]